MSIRSRSSFLQSIALPPPLHTLARSAPFLPRSSARGTDFIRSFSFKALKEARENEKIIKRHAAISSASCYNEEQYGFEPRQVRAEMEAENQVLKKQDNPKGRPVR